MSRHASTRRARSYFLAQIEREAFYENFKPGDGRHHDPAIKSSEGKPIRLPGTIPQRPEARDQSRARRPDGHHVTLRIWRAEVSASDRGGVPQERAGCWSAQVLRCGRGGTFISAERVATSSSVSRAAGCVINQVITSVGDARNNEKTKSGGKLRSAYRAVSCRSMMWDPCKNRSSCYNARTGQERSR